MSKEWKRRLICVVLCFFVSCIAETLALVFTDNLKYEISPNAVPVEKYENLKPRPTIWKDKKVVYRVTANSIDLQAISFEVSDITDPTTIWICDEKSTVYAKQTIRYSTNATFPLDHIFLNCSEFFLVCNDTVTIEQIMLSDEELSIVPNRVFHILRFVCWFLLALLIRFMIHHYKEIKDSLSIVYKRFIKLNWKQLLGTLLLFQGLSLAAAGILYVILKPEYLAYVILWAVLGGFLLFVFFLYFQKTIKKVETLYLLTVLILMSSYIIMMPIYLYGGDNSTHFNRVISVSAVYEAVNYGTYSQFLEDNGDYLLEDVEQNYETMLKTGVSIQQKPLFAIYFPNERYISYLPGVIAYLISDAFNFSPHLAFYVGEFAQSILAFFLVYAGLKRLKSGKLILMVFATLPNIFRLFCIYTYNNWILAWMFYFMAYIISEVQDREKIIQPKDLFKILGSFFLAVLPKTPYFILGFMMLLIPKEKFYGKISYKKFLLACFGTMLLLFVILLMPILVGNMEVYTDIRGGEDVSASGQAIFILTHPIRYAGILLLNLKDLFAPSYAVFGNIGLMILRTSLQIPLSGALAILFLVVVFFDHCNKDSFVFSIKKRLLIYLLFAFNTIWITTIMYMNYTPVGSDVIQGMNPLYATAYTFPLWFCLGIRKYFGLKHKRIFNCCVWGVWVSLLYFGIFKLLICSVIM